MFLSAPDSIFLKIGKLRAQPCSEFSPLWGKLQKISGIAIFLLTVCIKYVTV